MKETIESEAQTRHQAHRNNEQQCSIYFFLPTEQVPLWGFLENRIQNWGCIVAERAISLSFSKISPIEIAVPSGAKEKE